MVITRVMYYKCNAPPPTYHYITLRDKVHLAHLWCEDHTKAHLWGYSPSPRTDPNSCSYIDASYKHMVDWIVLWSCALRGEDHQDTQPTICICSLRFDLAGNYSTFRRKDIFALFFWIRPRPAPIDH